MLRNHNCLWFSRIILFFKVFRLPPLWCHLLARIVFKITTNDNANWHWMTVLQALLEQQLAVERGKMETEKKKFQHAMDEKVKFHLLYFFILLKKWLSYYSSCIWLFHYLETYSNNSVTSCHNLYPAKTCIYISWCLTQRVFAIFFVSFPLWLNQNIFSEKFAFFFLGENVTSTIKYFWSASLTIC